MRVEGWESRLRDVISKHSKAGYVPGEFDCFRMAQDAVEAITGASIYPGIEYRDDKQALRAMLDRGFVRLGDAMLAILPERPRGLQKRGDLAVVESDRGDTLGIVTGATIVLKVGHATKVVAVESARLFIAVD
jgi:hypothetical protein